MDGENRKNELFAFTFSHLFQFFFLLWKDVYSKEGTYMGVGPFQEEITILLYDI